MGLFLHTLNFYFQSNIHFIQILLISLISQFVQKLLVDQMYAEVLNKWAYKIYFAKFILNKWKIQNASLEILHFYRLSWVFPLFFVRITKNSFPTRFINHDS